MMMTENKKPNIFVITPFNEDFLALFEEYKKQFSDSYEFTNAGDMDNQQNIIKDIVEGIANADVIIADLTGLNANVFYELGLAHAMNKKVIIITQDIDELPFDIKSYRANSYSLQFNKIPALLDEIRKLLAGAMDGSIKFGNPVSDYAPDHFPLIIQSEEPTQEEASKERDSFEHEDEGDKGFLDYIADISEKSSIMNTELTQMGKDLEEMNLSVKSATAEIERVKKASGSADVAFVRNICRKLSGPISECGDKFKDHVQKIGLNWDIVENSYLGLLDNKFTQKRENIKSLQESFNALEDLQNAIDGTNSQIDGLINKLNNCRGMERRLTKAIVSIITELQTYLSTTETIRSSIDRIISKGELVIESLQSM